MSKPSPLRTALARGRQAPLRERLLLAVDLLMLVVLFANLGLFILEALYNWAPSTALAQQLVPTIHGLYGQVFHAHFQFWDLAFVSVFLSEFILQWALAVRERRWSRWYAYPVMHWYDLLGCIPIGALRLLRVLRVIGLVLRLQRLGLIDVTGWRLWKLVRRLYEILMEELSDRVVVNVLGGVQREIRSGGLMEREIAQRVLVPRKAALVKSLAHTLERIAAERYAAHKTQLDELLREIVHAAVEQNRELGRIERIPMLGDYISQSIEHAIHDISSKVIAEGVARLAAPELEQLLGDLVDSLLAAPTATAQEGPDAVAEAVIEFLELLKERVSVKGWMHNH